ncbi:SH3 domain-containing protein [Actinomadura terrae]|uniref:SH3 domain-containing protein n=1 Tax=Actinomadura terrae TaxID=604353 RepID=UPI001FA6E5CC|nr:SH3 domain-containing protein [Actinomadura terrae]
MDVGRRLGVGLAAVALAGTALTVGADAGASQPPPKPRGDAQAQNEGQQQAEPPPQDEEEGQGPGAIEVGQEGDQQAMGRLLERDEQRVRLCRGTVVVSRLNVRSGPGTGYHRVGVLTRGTRVTTDWDTIQRRDGYLWVRLYHSTHWIADYKTGDGNGKWYVRYSHC